VTYIKFIRRPKSKNYFFLSGKRLSYGHRNNIFLDKDVFVIFRRTTDRSYIGKVCKEYCASRQLSVLSALTGIGRSGCNYITREYKESNPNLNVLMNLRWRMTSEYEALYSYYKVIIQVTHVLRYLHKYCILLALVSLTM
jgi:hypothetical protein